MSEILQLHHKENDNISQVTYWNILFTCQNSKIYILWITWQFKKGEEEKWMKLWFPKWKQEVVDYFIENPDETAKNEVFEEASINLDVIKILDSADYNSFNEKIEKDWVNIYKSTHWKWITVSLSSKKINNLKGEWIILVDKSSWNLRRVKLVEIEDVDKHFKNKQIPVINKAIESFSKKWFKELSWRIYNVDN